MVTPMRIGLQNYILYIQRPGHKKANGYLQINNTHQKIIHVKTKCKWISQAFP